MAMEDMRTFPTEGSHPISLLFLLSELVCRQDTILDPLQSILESSPAALICETDPSLILVQIRIQGQGHG